MNLKSARAKSNSEKVFEKKSSENACFSESANFRKEYTQQSNASNYERTEKREKK